MDYDKKLQKVQETLNAISKQMDKVVTYHKKFENVPRMVDNIQEQLMDIKRWVQKPWMERNHHVELVRLSCNCSHEQAIEILSDNDENFMNVLLSRPDIKNRAELYLQCMRTFK